VNHFGSGGRSWTPQSGRAYARAMPHRSSSDVRPPEGALPDVNGKHARTETNLPPFCPNAKLTVRRRQVQRAPGMPDGDTASQFDPSAYRDPGSPLPRERGLRRWLAARAVAEGAGSHNLTSGFYQQSQQLVNDSWWRTQRLARRAHLGDAPADDAPRGQGTKRTPSTCGPTSRWGESAVNSRPSTFTFSSVTSWTGC
jgi:hypothetical protein